MVTTSKKPSRKARPRGPCSRPGAWYTSPEPVYMALSAIAESLERRRTLENKASGEEVPKIHVDEIALKVAAFYERARNIIDYKEEHLFRKRFISRALKRRLTLNGAKNIAEPLIKDVIRAGHLPNDKVPETKIPEIARIVDTYLRVRDGLRGEAAGERRVLTDWFFRVTASALEEALFPPVYDRTMADFMVTTILGNLTVRNATLEQSRVSTGIFVAVERALLRVDDDQLRLHLFRFLYPERADLSPDDAGALAGSLPEIENNIERALNDPKRRFFATLAHQWAPAFMVLGDVVRAADQHGELPVVLNDKEELESRAREAYRRRFRRARAKLRRFAFLTVISFFLSKIAIALAVEIPLQNYVFNDFSLAHTIANIVFAPLLMLIIVAFIRMPSRKNEALVADEIIRMRSDGASREYILAFPKKRAAAAEFAVRLFYLAMFFVSLYLIANLLLWLDFNYADIVIFVLFTSLVGAAGVKVHNRAREISLEKKKARVLGFVLDVFAIPFITIGTWIISGLSRFNFLVIAVDLLVDMPFHIFVEFVENVSDFIRGRKEAIE